MRTTTVQLWAVETVAPTRRFGGRPFLRSLILSTAVSVIVAATAWADAYIPKDDTEVLETLPKSVFSDEIVSLRQTLRSQPSDAKLAAKVANRYVEIGNVENAPRFYGYARAALKPWWNGDDAPAPILKLRAKLKEKEHQYDEALSDLLPLVEKTPRDAQAWIEIANIYRVKGKYEKARWACGELKSFSGPFTVAIGVAPIDAVTGHAGHAAQTLAAIAPDAMSKLPTIVPWIRTMQMQIAQSLGQSDEAERFAREGLALSPDDGYLRRAYADFLLDQNREREVLNLLDEQTNDNGLLLSLAIAARRCDERSLHDSCKRQLKNRFDEIRLRGGEPHGRFEARYYLELNDEPARALEIALANWKKQKELRDTRLVLEAALASKLFGAASEVIEFISRHGTEDIQLRKLQQQLQARIAAGVEK